VPWLQVILPEGIMTKHKISTNNTITKTCYQISTKMILRNKFKQIIKNTKKIDSKTINNN